MIEAPWVGKTPEECNHPDKREYTVYFTIQGSVTVMATSMEDAKEQVEDMSYLDLVSDMEEIEIDEVE